MSESRETLGKACAETHSCSSCQEPEYGGFTVEQTDEFAHYYVDNT